MNANSTPKFVDDGNGNIKIVLSNFTGELIARDIIGLTRYTGCPIPPKQPPTKSDGSRSPPFNHHGSDGSTKKVDGGNKESSQPRAAVLEEGIDRPDQEDNSSVNLLEDSGPDSDEDTVDDEESTVDELAQTADQKEGLNVSVAFDDDIEYEPELSQQVSYWKY